MNAPDHLTTDLLVRAFDDELSGSENAVVESHLPGCAYCRDRYAAIRLLSGRIESVVASGGPEAQQEERDALVQQLETVSTLPAAVKSYRGVVRTLGWSGSIAAAVLVALFVPRLVHAPKQDQIATLQYRPGGALEVDGETFIPLPYSNPDLPMSAPHIVEMQVPVASLASAGLVFEPVSSEAGGADRSVLADVLVGLDGQPLGVHVLSVE